MRSTRTFAIVALILSAQAVACSRESEDGNDSTSDLSDGTTWNTSAAPVAASGPAYSQQSGAVVIAGTDSYLAAWTELRLASKKTVVSVARIGKDGSLLDDKGIALPGLAGDDSGIAVASAGAGGYLAVWSHKTGNTSVINGVRIGADGKVLDAQPFTLGRANGHALTPAVAYTTGGYLVAWSDDRDSGATADSYVNEVYGARVSSAGQVVGSADGFRITKAPGTLEGGLSLAAVGSTFMVGYAKKGAAGSVPQAVRVSDAGAVLDATPINFGKGAAPSIATDGNQFFVAWTDGTTQGARVSKDGAKVDASPIKISNSAAASSVVWDGDAFSVAWANGAQRVGANGVLIGGVRASTGLSQDARPAMASLGSSLFVIHSVAAANGLPTHLSGNLLPKGDGAPIKSDITLARGSASLQTSVATTANGSNSLSVWLEYENATHPKINGAIFSNGTTKAVAIDPGTTLNGAPTVAFDGSTYVVAWQTGEGAAAQSSVIRVNDLGELVGAPKSYAGGSPQLTGGSNKALLTTDAKSYFLDGTVTFARAAEPAGWTAGPVAKPVWDGSRFVLAWAATKGAGSVEIHVQRFDLQGREMDRPAMKLATLPLPAGAALPKIAMAAGGGQTLFAFDNADRQIVGIRLNNAGIMDYAPARMDVGTGAASAPSVAWDGAQFTLAYERRADASSFESAIELTRVRGTPNGLDVSKTAEPLAARGLLPSAAGGARGGTFVSYSAISGDELGAPRIALGLFTDAMSGPGNSSSGGTTGPGGEEAETPSNPPGSSTSKGSSSGKPPTKGATINPGGGANGDDDGGESGCSLSTHASSSASSPLLFLALGALLLRRRRIRDGRCD